jgi:hypothetical protein
MGQERLELLTSGFLVAMYLRTNQLLRLHQDFKEEKENNP